MGKGSDGNQHTGKAGRQSMLTRQGVGAAGTGEAVREISSRGVGLPDLLMVADGVDTASKSTFMQSLCQVVV